MAAKRKVVLGLLGPVLDNGKGPQRWDRWRPTVSVCQHEDLLVDRLELLHEPKFLSLARQIQEDVGSCSPETTVRLSTIQWSDPWDFEGVYAALHDFARAYPFDPETEEYLVHITTGSHVAQICLFLLTEAHYFPAKLLQTSPPGKHPEDAGGYSIIDLDLSRYDRLASRFAQERKESTSFLKSGIETRNAHFNRLIDQIEKVAIHSRSPILLMGPTGAGKSQLARRIFELKKSRRQLAGGFVEVNCATLRGDAAMSALFGHVKGAFTGALKDRPGLLRSADGGLLLLDEIGELGLDEQAMLLRALEEKRFLPVGSDREARSDFQLIAGTNRDLAAAVAQGRFREDLLARINLWTFSLPSLHDRREDIEPNIHYELDRFAQGAGTQITFNREAYGQYLAFATSAEALWKANFRDLNASIVRMATFAAGGRITQDIVAGEIGRLQQLWTSRSGSEIASQTLLREHLSPEVMAQLDPFDRVQLQAVVQACLGSRSLSDAGRQLFAVSRLQKQSPNDADRLRKYLARFGLDFQKLQHVPAGT